MNRRSLENMRTDRRLAGRGGWISRADLDRETEALPDASGKIAEEEAEPKPDETAARQPEADPQLPGGFETA